jgi:hypothetical protein
MVAIISTWPISSVATSMIILVLAGHPAVPALEQVLHGDGHLAVSTADELLELMGVHRVGLLGLCVELQVISVPKHETPSRECQAHPRGHHRARARALTLIAEAVA